jgi:ATP-dependent RNA helicase RhlE
MKRETTKMTNFSGLDLIEPLQRALSAEGYAAPTPIQAQSIPHLTAGRDLLGVAQTGTGKTAAFVLPMLQSLTETSNGRPQAGRPRALVLAPTRELAIQIGDSVKIYGQFLNIKATTIFGGTSQGQQVAALNQGVDIVVATPGRLLDLMNQGKLRLDQVGIYVLDEADRMLDMGFIHDVRKITDRVSKDRQTLLFSATMPSAVAKLANGLLTDPIRVEIAAQSTTAERIDQRVLFVAKAQKRNLLSTVLEDSDISRALVFTRTKHGANRVAKHLEQKNVRCGVIHGNKSQNARQEALKSFKDGKLRILVATDIAARGIDVEGVTHVINFDLPNDPETYVHRIGRTARAGAAGQAISFCDEEEREYLFDIEKIIRKMIDVEIDHPFHSQEIEDAERSVARPKNERSGGRRNANSNKKRRSKNNGGGNGGHAGNNNDPKNNNVKKFTPRRHKGKRPGHSGNSGGRSRAA